MPQNALSLLEVLRDLLLGAAAGRQIGRAHV